MKQNKINETIGKSPLCNGRPKQRTFKVLCCTRLPWKFLPGLIRGNYGIQFCTHRWINTILHVKHCYVLGTGPKHTNTVGLMSSRFRKRVILHLKL